MGPQMTFVTHSKGQLMTDPNATQTAALPAVDIPALLPS